MQFYEKLDFLMNITNSSNSALGQKVKLDPSHISRLRRGKRNALKDETVLSAMADFFARHCTSDYQYKALTDIIGINITKFDNSELPILIAKWLTSKKKDEVKAVGGFLNGLNEINANFKIPERLPNILNQKNGTAILPNDEISAHYGVEGKRQAAEYFLMEVIAQSTPQTLLLYSDEATDWMTTDREFAAKWAQLMIGVLSKGNKIIIIHTVSRDLDEMLSAIFQWLPLYMTGLIEPYYYPKKRDGVFKSTLFISPGVCAVVSSSIGSSIEHAVNLLIRNSYAIDAYTEEFNLYLSQCKLLMQIFTERNKESYLLTLQEFEKEKSNSIVQTESLSLLTMPEKVSLSIMSRIEVEISRLSEYHRQRGKVFEKNLHTNTFCEIVTLFDLDTIKSGKIKVSFSDMMNGGSVYYTVEEYTEHLEHLVHLLKTCENFHIKLIARMPESNYMVYAKEDLGVIVAKTSAPPVVIAINETNLTAAFWDFLRNIIGDKGYQSINKIEETKRLEAYIQQIRNA